MKKLTTFALTIFILFFHAYIYAGSTQTSNTFTNTVITNARYILNETSESFWSDTELLSWLNDGILDIVTRTGCLENTEDLTLVANTLEYTLVADYIAIKGVAYKTSGIHKGLRRIEPNNIEHTEDVDEPVEWWEWDGKIGVSPLPSATVAGDYLVVHFIDLPTTVTITDNVLVPAVYDKALTYFIVAKGHIKERRADKATQYMRNYTAELDRYRMDFGEKVKK